MVWEQLYENMILQSHWHTVTLSQVRDDELEELDRHLHDICPHPVTGGTENTEGKVNVLLQSYISKQSVDNFSLVSDMAYVAQVSPNCYVGNTWVGFCYGYRLRGRPRWVLAAFYWPPGCPDSPHTEAATTLASHWLSGCPDPPHTEAATTLASHWLSRCPDPPHT